jgi:DNA ligase-associated metallophosphoesterase
VILSAGMPEQEVEVAGEKLVARADASLFWPAERTLFVADVHLGKAASFRSHAVPVPVGTTESTLNRLGCAVSATGSQRVVLLGDLWHSKEGRRPEICASLEAWRAATCAEVILVEGNHDRRAGGLPVELDIRTEVEPLRLGPFALCHYPCEVADAYCLAGHIHPAVSLTGRGRQSLRLPCFWFGPRCAVLPAFGDFTGKADIVPKSGDRVLVIADERLHEARFEPVCP